MLGWRPSTERGPSSICTTRTTRHGLGRLAGSGEREAWRPILSRRESPGRCRERGGRRTPGMIGDLAVTAPAARRVMARSGATVLAPSSLSRRPCRPVAASLSPSPATLGAMIVARQTAIALAAIVTVRVVGFLWAVDASAPTPLQRNRVLPQTPKASSSTSPAMRERPTSRRRRDRWWSPVAGACWEDPIP